MSFLILHYKKVKKLFYGAIKWFASREMGMYEKVDCTPTESDQKAYSLPIKCHSQHKLGCIFFRSTIYDLGISVISFLFDNLCINNYIYFLWVTFVNFLTRTSTACLLLTFTVPRSLMVNPYISMHNLVLAELLHNFWNTPLRIYCSGYIVHSRN